MRDILEEPAIRQRINRMTVDQYHRMSASGVVPEKTELLRGMVVARLTKSPLHTYMAERLSSWLRGACPAGNYVRQEGAITLSESEPEPNVAVVRGNSSDYLTQHPTSAQLVIEVAVSSIEEDRIKAAIYAEAGIPEYWIVLPKERAVDVYTQPTADGYQQVQRIEDPQAELRPLVFEASHPGGITLGEMFAELK
jgi:Uma2 family endonuclease